MKKAYLIVSIVFLLYGINLYFEHKQERKLPRQESRYSTDNPIQYSLEFNSSSYIFKNRAWDIKDEKIEDLNQSSIDDNKVVEITVYRKSSPIKICEASHCYELIALKNSLILLYGKEKVTDKKERFISLRVGEYLGNRIRLESLENSKIKLCDSEFNKTVTINMFDINVSEYEPKKKLFGEKNEE